jgi:hypothetical protein
MKERDENWQLIDEGVLKGEISGKISAVDLEIKRIIGRQVSRVDFAPKFRAVLEGLEGEGGDDADCMQILSARWVSFRFCMTGRLVFLLNRDS